MCVGMYVVGPRHSKNVLNLEVKSVAAEVFSNFLTFCSKGWSGDD